uniref:Uncharacterized protein n=2 Tax=Ixodes ricinus TaxID=34613 RepID=V5GJ47_IXORI
MTGRHPPSSTSAEYAVNLVLLVHATRFLALAARHQRPIARTLHDGALFGEKTVWALLRSRGFSTSSVFRKSAAAASVGSCSRFCLASLSQILSLYPPKSSFPFFYFFSPWLRGTKN